MADIAMKLQLDSPQDAEYIIAKAIRDGVIEASLDHQAGYMQSKVLHYTTCAHTHTPGGENLGAVPSPTPYSTVIN